MISFMSGLFGITSFSLMLYLMYKIITDYFKEYTISNIDLFIVAIIFAILAAMLNQASHGKDSKE